MLRKHSLLLYAITALYTLSAVSIANHFFSSPLWLTAVCLLCALALYALLLVLVDYGERRFIDRLLMEKCDPPAYLWHYNRYYRLADDAAPEPIQAICKSAAAMALGNLNEGERLLRGIKPKLIDSNAVLATFYHINLSALFCLREQAVAARYYIDMAQRYAGYAADDNKGFRRYVDKVIALNSIDIARLSGELSLIECRERLTAMLPKLPHKIDKMVLLFNLAELEYKLHNYEQAAAHFSRVHRDGNKLYIAAEAQKKLRELSLKNPKDKADWEGTDMGGTERV